MQTVFLSHASKYRRSSPSFEKEFGGSSMLTGLSDVLSERVQSCSLAHKLEGVLFIHNQLASALYGPQLRGRLM